MEPGRITAEGGSFLIADTNSHTGKGAYAFIVQEDTVITTLLGGDTASGVNYNMLTSHGLSGETLKAGLLVMARKPFLFNNIQLSSGSIMLYYSAEYGMSMNVVV